MLKACLDSIAACRPRPAEVVVVDQSGDQRVADLVAGREEPGVRHVPSEARGVAAARNAGLQAAAHDIVLMTDDDCTVAPDWVGTGARLVAGAADLIVTGRVLPADDSEGIPSTIVETERREYTGTRSAGVLYTGNVALHRAAVLAIGGFDEALETAEDNDLCYRWLTAGHRLAYEPSMVVWHHDWRSPAELDRLYVSYWRGQGALYAKHLSRGDLRMVRFAGRDLYTALRALAGALRGRRLSPTDWRRGIWRGLPVGFARHLLRGR